MHVALAEVGEGGNVERTSVTDIKQHLTFVVVEKFVSRSIALTLTLPLSLSRAHRMKRPSTYSVKLSILLII